MKIMNIVLLLFAATPAYPSTFVQCWVQAQLADPYSKIEPGSIAADFVTKSNSGKKMVTFSKPLSKINHLQGPAVPFAYRNSDGSLVTGTAIFRSQANGLFFSGHNATVFINGRMSCEP